jgi:hypothetical protein
MPDAMPNEHGSRAETSLAALEAEIAAGQVEVCRSVLDEPYILFHDTEPPARHSLYGRSIKDVLTDRAWTGGHGLLKKHEVERIVAALAGRAMKSPCCGIEDPELLRLIEAEPVLAVAIEYVDAKRIGRLEKSMAELHKEWLGFAREHGLLSVGRKRFPAAANVLSRKLKQFDPVLQQLRIKVTMRRSNGCQITIEVQQDDTVAKPSSRPSAGNPSEHKDLPRVDDKEALLAELELRKAESDRTRSPK